MGYRIAIEVQSPVDERWSQATVERALHATLSHMAQPDGTGLSLTIVADDIIRTLNRDYRGIDAPTDVLSFSALEGEAFVVPQGLDRELGDIVISWETAARQAAHMGHEVMAEVALLAIHGCLHLLGLDHGTPEEQAEMWHVQDTVLDTLNLGLRSYVGPYDEEDAGDE